MFWAPFKPLLHGLGLIAGAAEASAPQLVKIAEDQHLVSGPLAKALQDIADSIAKWGVTFTFCNFKLTGNLAIALLGAAHPSIAAHLAKLSDAGMAVHLTTDAPPVVTQTNDLAVKPAESPAG